MKYNPYCKNLKVKVFDIETTGLYPDHDHIVSASFINPDGSDLVQYFCEAPQMEDLIVDQIIGQLSECDAVITYNGNMFDIPFVLKRAKKLHVADELPLFWSMDIYRWLKAYWPQAQRMYSLSQKSVEEALGLSEKRTDEIDGGECISLYNEYVLWNRKDAKELILLHNGDDVRQLAKIAQMLSFLPYHKIVFEKGYKGSKALFSGSKLLKSKLKTEAKLPKGGLAADIYNDSYHMVYDPESGETKLEVYTMTKNSYQFADLKTLCENTEEFEDLEGFDHGFLILRKGEQIYHKECIRLCEYLINKL